MRSAKISRRRVEALLGETADPDELFAVQETLAMRAEREEVARYIEDMERALELERRQAHHSVPRFNGRVPAERIRRRVERTVVRSLPSRIDGTTAQHAEVA